ncbi:uncharacterized protein LOC122381173 [Amphibalanus amphitrite]|nr:uncharacterized protein LOC122381173 [Amphibalanus amphitrite]
MLSRVLILAVAIAMAVAEEPMDLTRVQRGALYIRLPAPYSTAPTQCYDPQIDEYFNEGDVWSSSYSGCKLSTCVDINGILNVERYSCPLVSKGVDFKRLKKENYYCRQAWGNRNKQFPSCCPSLQCKYYEKGKLMPLPKHMYPLL